VTEKYFVFLRTIPTASPFSSDKTTVSPTELSIATLLSGCLETFSIAITYIFYTIIPTISFFLRKSILG